MEQVAGRAGWMAEARGAETAAGQGVATVAGLVGSRAGVTAVRRVAAWEEGGVEGAVAGWEAGQGGGTAGMPAVARAADWEAMSVDLRAVRSAGVMAEARGLAEATEAGSAGASAVVTAAVRAEASEAERAAVTAVVGSGRAPCHTSRRRTGRRCSSSR